MLLGKIIVPETMDLLTIKLRRLIDNLLSVKKLMYFQLAFSFSVCAWADPHFSTQDTQTNNIRLLEQGESRNFGNFNHKDIEERAPTF